MRQSSRIWRGRSWEELSTFVYRSIRQDSWQPRRQESQSTYHWNTRRENGSYIDYTPKDVLLALQVTHFHSRSCHLPPSLRVFYIANIAFLTCISLKRGVYDTAKTLGPLATWAFTLLSKI